MNVLKFGGTSAGSIEAIETLVEIVRESGEKVVVVSAFSGVTDELIGAAGSAERREEYLSRMDALLKRHRAVAFRFLSAHQLEETLSGIEGLFVELKDLLRSVELLRDLTKRSLDQIMSFGERLSAMILARVLSAKGMEACFVDARDIIRTDDSFGSARCLRAESRPLVIQRLSHPDRIAVIPGFIGATADGVTTTLGRGGSDLTASIIGSSLGAAEIQIWSDVDGMMTADQQLVKDTFLIEEISYDEALEMTHFGAKVLNPLALLPAMEEGVPIRILNTFNPQGKGTRIVKQAGKSGYPVRGLASIPAVSLLSIRGLGLPGVTGIAGRMFGALARRKVNVILISQASSELSICCAINPDDASAGQEALAEEFAPEIGAGFIGEPSVESDLCVIAVVGEQMKQKTGIAGRIFSALGRNGVNVVAIAQGSSELNISIVTSARNRAKALNVIHDSFFLAGMRTVNLFLVGTGLIGGTLLAQIADQREKLLREHSIRINLVGLANSRKMLIDPNGIDAAGWERPLMEGRKADFPAFIEAIKALNLPSACFCDCTASEYPPDHYKELFDASISVVTPNKRANAGPAGRYSALKAAAREKDVVYGYETTVGAGLPVIGTLHDLVACGDTISRIEAVLSGTVSYIFNQLGGGKSFSALVLEAKARGYTEPDPRDDLGAIDIARKTLILSREAGFAIDLDDILIQPILPESLTKAPNIECFLSRLLEADASIDILVKAAASRGKVLRYVATILPDSASLSLMEYGPESPFYNLSDTDNLVMFSTVRYSANPLVVRGPGAGAAVTAGGVFADILKTAQ
ncbi:MAG: bifunctional aspartate kinase/homoserine dehydrogenase I, partial [Rectinemataceae bacterium]